MCSKYSRHQHVLPRGTCFGCDHQAVALPARPRISCVLDLCLKRFTIIRNRVCSASELRIIVGCKRRCLTTCNHHQAAMAAAMCTCMALPCCIILLCLHHAQCIKQCSWVCLWPIVSWAAYSTVRTAAAPPNSSILTAVQHNCCACCSSHRHQHVTEVPSAVLCYQEL